MGLGFIAPAQNIAISHEVLDLYPKMYEWCEGTSARQAFKNDGRIEEFYCFYLRLLLTIEDEFSARLFLGKSDEVCKTVGVGIRFLDKDDGIGKVCGH